MTAAGERRVHDRLLQACYGVLAGVTAVAMVTEVPVSVHLMCDAVATVYIGCHMSLLVQEKDQEYMQKKDAAMFPIIGSAALLSMYIVFKLVPPEWTSFVIKCYFLLFGTLAVGQFLTQTLSQFLPPSMAHAYERVVFSLSVPFIPLFNPKPSDPKEMPDDTPVTVLDIIGTVLGAASSYMWFITEHWSLNNLIGIAICVQAIQLLNLGSFRNGAILLCGLFIYDVVWVFGSEVMVSVAKNFNGPIKLLFPRLDAPASLLGLGDIVIPGAFVALMLRLDRTLHPGPTAESLPRSRFYFWTCFAAYTAGLVATLAVMALFKHAQPALLYLVPACLLSVLFAALFQRQLSVLVAYNEDPDHHPKVE